MPINAIRGFVMGAGTHPAVLAGDAAARDNRNHHGHNDAEYDSVRLSGISGHLATLASGRAREDALDIVSIQVAELRTKLMDELARRMRESGVDPEVKISLRLDKEGIHVTGEQPQAVKVERLLTDDPSLAQIFRNLATHSDLLRSLRAANVGHARQAAGYQAYTRAATELEGSQAAFVLALLGSQATSYFDWQ